MTQAPDAMVKAMAKEIERQTAQFHIDDENRKWITSDAVDGSFNLEKISRACLAAIREPSFEMGQAGGEFEIPVCDWNSQIGEYGAEGAWRLMIDKILEEKAPGISDYSHTEVATDDFGSTTRIIRPGPKP